MQIELSRRLMSGGSKPYTEEDSLGDLPCTFPGADLRRAENRGLFTSPQSAGALPGT
jgi:hypothetical protein